MNEARERSRMRTRDLWTCFVRIVSSSIFALGEKEEKRTHVSRINLISLNDVHDTDVAAALCVAGVGGRNEAVLGLEKAAHDVEDGGFADGARL
jgi:hypothetical protein